MLTLQPVHCKVPVWAIPTQSSKEPAKFVHAFKCILRNVSGVANFLMPKCSNAPLERNLVGLVTEQAYTGNYALWQSVNAHDVRGPSFALFVPDCTYCVAASVPQVPTYQPAEVETHLISLHA